MATATRRTRKTDAERDAQITEITEQFQARLAAIATNPDEWLTLIDSVADFGARYSLNNQVLLLWQAAERGIEPQYFQPYGTYAKVDGDAKKRDTTKPLSGWVKAGRQVRKGEKAFLVWAPVFRTPSEEEAARAKKPMKRNPNGSLAKQLVSFRLSPTFELSQTDGDTPFEVPTIERRRIQKLPGGKQAELLEGDDPTGAYLDVVSEIEKAGYSFSLVPAGELGGANGMTRAKGNGTPVDVRVRDDISDAQRIKTTIHEWAHIACGHLDADADYGHRGQGETEAESVAHIVTKALGLDSSGYSDAYVLGWADGDLDLIKKTLEKVIRVSKAMLAALDPATDEAAPAKAA